MKHQMYILRKYMRYMGSEIWVCTRNSSGFCTHGSLSDLVFINACAWIKSFISMTVCPKKEFLSILYNIFNNTRTAYMRHPCRIKPCSASLPYIAVYYQDTKKHYFFSQMSYKKTFYHSLRIFIKLNQTN